MLELRLMHRWSTITYKSVTTPIFNDAEVWQIDVPDIAIEHDFLLNTLFALSAFEIAANSSSVDHREHYLGAAFEYQGQAIRGFQSGLRTITDSSYESVFFCSILLLVLTLASARFVSAKGEPDSKIRHTFVHRELLRGLGVVVLENPDFIDNHATLGKLKMLHELPRTQLDTSTAATLDRIKELNLGRQPLDPAKSLMNRVQLVKRMDSCREALISLEDMFAISAQPEYTSYSIGWIALVSDDYIAAVEESDQVALLTLACWGVLVQKLGRQAWWAENFGKSLIEEIVAAMPVSFTAGKILSWAQEQVSIGCSLNAS